MHMAGGSSCSYSSSHLAIQVLAADAVLADIDLPASRRVCQSAVAAGGAASHPAVGVLCDRYCHAIKLTPAGIMETVVHPLHCCAKAAAVSRS
jgi:hypothetical protein